MLEFQLIWKTFLYTEFGILKKCPLVSLLRRLSGSLPHAAGKLKFLFCEGKDKQTNAIAKKTAGKASKKTESRQSTVQCLNDKPELVCEKKPVNFVRLTSL